MGQKLSFDLFENALGFKDLQQEEVKAFLSSFELFEELSWEGILKSGGLQYKQYSPASKNDDWFEIHLTRERVFTSFELVKNTVALGSVKMKCFMY